MATLLMDPQRGSPWTLSEWMAVAPGPIATGMGGGAAQEYPAGPREERWALDGQPHSAPGPPSQGDERQKFMMEVGLLGRMC